MPARIVALTSHNHPSHHRCRWTASPRSDVRDWYIDLVALVSAENDDVPPQRINVRWLIDIDPLQRRYQVSVLRGDLPHVVLQAGFRPSETPEQAAHREGGLRLLHELLSASYGVPA